MFDGFDKKKVIIIGLICVFLIIGGSIYYFLEYNNQDFVEFEDEIEISENKQENIIAQEIKKIVVHISGQVINPGVITLNENSRIVDAINEAGGLTNLADLNKINLAYVLEDAQKIYIPSVDDKEESKYILNGSGDTEIVTSSGSYQNKKEEKLMVNINTANAIELSKLPGIGNSTALKIINYRNENGKFNTIDDIKNVSGIGENKFNKIKDNIFVK